MTMPPRQPDAPSRRISRRRLLLRLVGGGMVAGSTVASAGVYAKHVEPFWPATERLTMDLPNLPPALVGLRVLHLSDLHVDSKTASEYIGTQLRACRDLQPDLVVITGDFITAINRRWTEHLPQLLRPLAPPLGTFAVLGNHDFGVYSPHRHPRGEFQANRVQQVLEDGNVAVLRNATRTVMHRGAHLQIVGIDDRWSGFCDPAAAFADADPELPTIALTHNPDTMEDLRNWPCDWVLAGHTHGGQVRIPLLGAPKLPVKHREWDAGRFDIGRQTLYVSRGLGYLIQVRFNCRPEITLFTLAARS